MNKLTLEEIEELSPEQLMEYTKQFRGVDKHAVRGTTSQHLRNQVLEHGLPMIIKLQEIVYNGDEMTVQQSIAYERLWPIIEDIIKSTSDLKKIEAANASEVLGLVASGKITMKEGMVMMSLLQSKVEIEELPKLLDKLEAIEGE